MITSYAIGGGGSLGEGSPVVSSCTKHLEVVTANQRSYFYIYFDEE